MFGLEELGLLGLFIGTFLAATILPFSSDALYLAILAATRDTAGCLLVGTLGNWLGSVLTYWIGWVGKWEWIEKWFKVRPETLQKAETLCRQIWCMAGADLLDTGYRRCHSHCPQILQDQAFLDHGPSACRKIPPAFWSGT